MLTAAAGGENAPEAPAASLPPAEMVSRSAVRLAEMRQVLQDSLARLEEARNTKDLVKLDCVNGKLTQVKGLLRISEQADVSLQESLAKKEQLNAEHEYTKVSIAGEKVRALRGEAEQCIGQLAFRTDQNLTVEVEEPNNLPRQDETDFQKMSPPSTRPLCASPVL